MLRLLLLGLALLIVVLAVLAAVRAQDPQKRRRYPADARARGGMSRAEALEVLGLGEQASRLEILRAYRHLMRQVHPDSKGGSTYLASKLNEAKQVLIR